MNKRLGTVFDHALPARLRAIVLAALIGMLSPAVATSAGDSVEQILAAVVGVHARVPAEARTAEALGTERSGSGVLIDSNGLVVTIGYLILEAEQVEIVLPNDARVPVEVLAYDHESGFGLLRAGGEVNIRPMELGSSAGLEPGDRLLIASHGGAETVRPAIFAGAREFAGYWEYLLEDALFTVPPYPRYGGAALLSPAGRLLGIGSLAVGDAIDDSQQIPGNMFVPIDRFKAVLGDLLLDGRSSGPQRPWLGIYTDEIEGILVVRWIAEESPAMSAGVEPGDIIVAAGGRPVLSMADFYRKLWAQGEAGDTVSIAVIRDGDMLELKIRSGDRYRWLHQPQSE